MLVFNTQMHVITFVICLVELIFLFYQFIYYLYRPSDKKRKYYLILLFLLIQKNLTSGLLPDMNLTIHLIFQSILSYASSLVIAMYIPYYFYKAYGLTELKFHAYRGVYLFLLLPYLICFVVPYIVTGNLQVSVRMFMIIPFFYAIAFLNTLAWAIRAKNTTDTDPQLKRERKGIFIGIVSFVLLPIMAFFKNELDQLLAPILHFNDGSQVIEVVITNFTLLLFTVIFIRSTVKQSKAEYEKLLRSEKELLELNSGLVGKVKEWTEELELANEQRTLIKMLLNQESSLITNTIATIKEVPQPPSTETVPGFDSNCVKYNLTRREIEVIRLMSDGKVTKEIAAVLFISVETVRKHIQNSYEKVGVNSKFELLKKLENSTHTTIVK